VKEATNAFNRCCQPTPYYKCTVVIMAWYNAEYLYSPLTQGCTSYNRCISETIQQGPVPNLDCVKPTPLYAQTQN